MFTKVVSVTSTGAATQDITFTPNSGDPASWTPKLAIVKYSRANTAADTFHEHCSQGIGFTDGVNQRCVGTASEDNQGNGDTASIQANNALIYALSPTGTINAADAIATFNSWLTNGMRINWTDAPAANFLMEILFLGGDDLTNIKIGTLMSGTGTGTVSDTTTTWTPEFGLFLTGGVATENSPVNEAFMSMGAAISSSAQWVQSIYAQDNPANMVTRMYYSHTNLIVTNNTAVTGLAAFSSFNSNGFSISISDAFPVSIPIYYLIVDGGEWHVGNNTEPASVSTQTNTTSKHTKGAMVFGLDTGTANAPQAGCMSTVGMGDSALNQGLEVFEDITAGTTSIVVSRHDTNQIYHNITANATAASTTLDDECALSAVSSTGFTLNWTNIGQARPYRYLSFGGANVFNVTKQTTTKFDIIQEVPKSVTVKSDIYQEVVKQVTAKFNIIQEITKQVTTSFDILAESIPSTFMPLRSKKGPEGFYYIGYLTPTLVDVVKTTTVKFDIYEEVDKSFTSIYNIFQETSKQVTTNFNIIQEVHKQVIAKFDILQEVPKSTTVRFNILQEVSKQITTLFSILQEIIKSVNTRFNILQEVTKQVDTKFHINQEVSKTTEIKFHILQEVAKQTTTLFHIYQETIKNVTTLFNIIQEVSKTSTVKFDIIQEVTKQVTAVFDIIEEGLVTVTKSTTTLFNILQEVPKSTTTRFDIFEEVEKDVTVRFSILQEVSKIVSVRFDILQEIMKTNNTIFSIFEEVQKDVAVNFDIFQTVEKEVNSLFSIAQEVTKEVNTLFNIFEEGALIEVTKTLTSKFDIHQEVSIETAVKFAILQEVVKTVRTLFDIKDKGYIDSDFGYQRKREKSAFTSEDRNANVADHRSGFKYDKKKKGWRITKA